MGFLIRLVVNAVALAAAAWLFDGIEVGGADDGDRVLTLLVVALIFGLVNAFIAPIVKLLSLPFIVLTLGLLLLVINALMLLLTSRLAEAFDVEFTVDGFWAALGGSIVISIVGALLGAVLDDD
jgi:putative membrane protein